MKKIRTSRRRFLQLAGVGATGVLFSRRDVGAEVSHAGAGARGAAAADGAAAAAVVALADRRILVEFDSNMRLRVWQLREGPHGPERFPVMHWAAPDSLLLEDGSRVDSFALREQSKEGARAHLVGVAGSNIEKTVVVELLESYPGFAVFRISYRNVSTRPIRIRGWTNSSLQLARGGIVRSSAASQATATDEPLFWSFCGSTHADRRDWVQPLRPGFKQDNFMGMSASDYGGGTPIVDVWRKDCGIALGHLEPVPQLVSLPLECTARGASLSMTAAVTHTLQPGETFSTPETFITTHSGDYFTTLDTYRRIMATRGIASPTPPKSAYESIWCAWGYERDCTLQLIADTLPKVQDLGLRWAVIDDGWQSNVGDWKLSAAKYPGGEADMQGLVRSIRARDLKPRLWWAPLAAAPGSDLLHDHTDMLLLDKEGAVQNVSWWNSFYLCPAYAGTVSYTLDLARKFIGDWGFDGLKIDGQHLNSVAPCYNPAHHHARPEESVEKLQDLLLAVYQTATQLNPEAVVELCPCGTSYSFFNFRSFNHAPASDPESSWQVRHKGKALKALMGTSAAFAGDHVELSAGGCDFASTVGIGGIVSTKFTWPVDPKPKDSFLLTPAREALWRKWIALYNEHQLPLGNYRGELYDIGFDKPETHVVEKSGRFYYAFYAREFSGTVPLRGLTARRYRVRDYFNGKELGEVAGSHGRLQLAFNDFLVLEAVPV
jgi:alpha-galactosidase